MWLHMSMAEKKPTPRGTKIFAAAVFGGLGAAVIGQRTSEWTLASQTNTLIVVALGAVVGAVVGWFVTRPRS
jgi:hypothetical protein